MLKRTALILALWASILAPLAPAHAGDASPHLRLAASGPEETPAAADDGRLLIAGLGAIAGVVAFNLAMGGTGALPFFYEAAGTSGAAASGAVAASRVYAVSTAVGGALIADSLYRRSAHADARTISRTLTDRVAPR